MSYGKKDPNFPLNNAITDKTICQIVASSLRQEYGDHSSSLKHIARLINANPRTVKNWMIERNAPSAACFLKLAICCKPIRDFILETINSEPDRIDSRTNYQPLNREIRTFYTEVSTEEDMTNLCNDLLYNQLNERQLWFLQELSQKRKISAQNIADFWSVTPRTAWKDIKLLTSYGLIEFTGPKKTGYYELGVKVGRWRKSLD